MSFSQCPAYLPSGANFVERGPAHWSVKPLWACCTCNDDVLPESTPEDQVIRYVEISDVTLLGGMGSGEEMLFASAPSRARRRVRKGDTIVSTVRTYLRAIAPVDADDPKLTVSTGFAVLRPRSVHPGYLRYVLTSEEMISSIISHSKGVSYPAINAGDLVRLKAAFPPAPEQRFIADFLDRETAKLDSLAAEQKILLGLLKEKQAAHVSSLITKGLDSSAEMKESGVPWVGCIPKHWSVAPLMRLVDEGRPVMYGIVLPGEDVGVGIPIVKGGNVKPSRLNLASLARTTPEIEAPYARARLRPGDLVYAIRGTIGDCEPVPPELEGANITQDVARVAPREGVNGSWLRHALLSKPVREALSCGSLGAAVRGINIFDLKRVRIPVPPPEERDAIACRLDEDTRALEALAAEARASIALLRERRAALVSAAVTGRIDIRAATSRDVGLAA